ncbi:MAG: dihydroorotase [Desulfobacterales bacterium]|nr:dihydroorotase [Desulfobacterales bacterium]
MRILIKGGRVIDPGHLDGISDIIIEDGKVKDIIENGIDDALSISDDIKIIDAAGKYVTPGLIDMHVHLREPGFEYKETIETGCKAAAAGGFTAVCPMPNTDPVNDGAEVTRFIIDKAQKAGAARVFPVAAISKGQKGEGLCNYGELKDAGAVAFSDDGLPVLNSNLMRRSMECAKQFNIPVISHSEDPFLANGGSMNEGEISAKLGLQGIPNACESIMVLRDIALSELTGAALHIAHVSTRESVTAIRDAKKRGVNVTAETAPHYFTLTDEAVVRYNTHAKMNPPLRTEADRMAICEGLADGTLDAIATDHAPHAPIDKDVAFDRAANGIIGLETSLPVSLKLVEKGILSMYELVEKMSKNPAKILGLDSGLSKGMNADLTIIDPGLIFTVSSEHFRSLAINTPFEGWELKGKAVLTMVGGIIVFES